MTDHLLPQEQSTLKVLLRERLDSLLKEIREDLLKSDDHRDAMLSDRVRDVGDESLADLIVDLDLADTDRDLEELRDVEAALARLDKGNYGACVKCGAPIPVARLKVYPTAKRCQPCQRIYEQTFAHKGRPSL